MPRPTLDGTTFVEINRSTNQQTQVVKEYSRPGIDGSAFTTFGKKAPPSVLICRVDVADAAAVVAMRTTLLALAGTKIDYVDDLGTTHENVVVERVLEIGKPQAIINAVGGEEDDPEFLMTFEVVIRETTIA